MKANKFFFAFVAFVLVCLFFFFFLFGVARAQARPLLLNDQLIALNAGAVQSLEPNSVLLLSAVADARGLQPLGSGLKLNLNDETLIGNINSKGIDSSNSLLNIKSLSALSDNLTSERLRLLKDGLNEQKIGLALKRLNLKEEALLLQGLDAENLGLLKLSLEV